MSPSKAAAFFHKTECFCFTQQVLQPGERIEMPVRFIVDRDLPADVRHLTLAYTLFDITSRQPPVAVVSQASLVVSWPSAVCWHWRWMEWVLYDARVCHAIAGRTS